MLFSQLVDAFVVAYRGRDTTLAGRLNWWVSELGTTPVVEITGDMVDAALMRLAARGKVHNRLGRGAIATGKPHSTSTLNRYRAALATVLTFAKERRIVPRAWHRPTDDIPQGPEAPPRETVATAAEIANLIKVARLSAWRKLPCLILLAFTTGMRRGSLLGLRWRDVDLEAKRLTVARTKNGKPHVAVLTDQAAAELAAIKPAWVDPSDLVFSGKQQNKAHDYRHSFIKAVADAGLPDTFVFHSLRHSCGTHLARSGAGLLQVADVLAHSNLSTTRRYAHLMIDDRARLVAQHFAAVA